MKRYPVLMLVFLMCLFSVKAYADAIVRITSTEPGSKVRGEGLLDDRPTGLKVTITIRDAAPGLHGIHIHEHGNCADKGNAAGGHFNPDRADHGLLMKDGLEHAHAGDLGNIEIGPDGTGSIDIIVPGLTASEGKYNVVGKSIILHEKEDDFGQPTGNSGDRVACGVII